MPRARSLRSLAISPPPARRTSSPGPPSPTFSDATNASAMNFGANGPEKIITRANLKSSLHAYEELMNSSATYRAALLTMSKVTAKFADSMETCSGLKGPSYEAGTRLQAASGLHHLIGNHWHVLAETLDKNFERPLRQHLETYRTIVSDRSASYEKALQERSHIIRQTEMGNMNKRQRNLQSFREALTVLQRQVDELDELKAQHYQEIMEHEEEVWDVVQAKICLTVRSTMDVFDRFTAKASDPVIEPMLQSIPDPFDSYPQQAEDQIFSILQPLSISANAPSPSPSPATASPPESSTMNATAAGISKWSSDTGDYYPAEPASEWADVPFPSSTPPPSSSTPPRSASPPSSIARRRQSHPPSVGNQSKKSGSKLKSVLSSIDERLTQNGSVGGDGTNDSATSPPLTLNGDTRVPDTSWGAFSYGESPYAAYSQAEDVTPRHSLYNQQPPGPFGPDPTPSSGLQVEDTGHVPLSS